MLFKVLQLTIAMPQNQGKKVKSSMAKGLLAVKNLLPQKVGLIINYLQ